MDTRKRFTAVLSLCLLALSGCIADDDITKTVTEFDSASTKLTTAFTNLIANANTIEANHFIDVQAFTANPITPADIARSAILTPTEIKLRTSAITALADYTKALATLASGKEPAKVQADFTATSASLGKLSTDATTALATPTPGSETANYATPVAAAVSAIGDVVDLVLRHRGIAEIKRVVTENDPRLTALYQEIGKESKILLLRQQESVRFTGVTLLADYNRQRRQTPFNSADLLQLTDRLKQWEKDTAVLNACDPQATVLAFQKSHLALVDAIKASNAERPETFAKLVAEVKSFASDVTPLAENTQKLANAL